MIDGQNKIVFGEYECAECGRPVSTVADTRGVHFIHTEDAYDMLPPDAQGQIFGSDTAHKRGMARKCIQARVAYRNVYPDGTVRPCASAWQWHEEFQPTPIPPPGEVV